MQSTVTSVTFKQSFASCLHCTHTHAVQPLLMSFWAQSTWSPPGAHRRQKWLHCAQGDVEHAALRACCACTALTGRKLAILNQFQVGLAYELAKHENILCWLKYLNFYGPQQMGATNSWWCQWKCVAVCYSVLQCVAVCCSVLQCVAVCNNVSFWWFQWNAHTHTHVRACAHAHTHTHRMSLISITRSSRECRGQRERDRETHTDRKTDRQTDRPICIHISDI